MRNSPFSLWAVTNKSHSAWESAHTLPDRVHGFGCSVCQRLRLEAWQKLQAVELLARHDCARGQRPGDRSQELFRRQYRSCPPSESMSAPEETVVPTFDRIGKIYFARALRVRRFKTSSRQKSHGRLHECTHGNFKCLKANRDSRFRWRYPGIMQFRRDDRPLCHQAAWHGHHGLAADSHARNVALRNPRLPAAVWQLPKQGMEDFAKIQY